MNLDEALKEIETLKAKNTALEAENKEFVTTNTDLAKTVEDLKAHTKNQADNFKKLRDMSDAEKELYTEKELELMKRNEAIEEQQVLFKKEQDEFKQKQKDAIIENLVTKYAKGDKELASQIKINLGKLNPELINPAITEAELTPHVESAFNMLGIKQSPDALREANNYSGGVVEVKSENDFSNTQAGKELAGSMGLNIGKVDTNNNKQ